mmetsp:Transcript_101421/g.217179  ORF Transcript_101421/g.217179 Transcript_101421/m.217179 type:complete len:320 (+) Transcript_101421:97-1056(+)
MAPGAAGTLRMEDELKKIIYRDGSKSVKVDKAKGMVPLGNHSCFGDFPPEQMHPDPWKKLARAKSSPGLMKSTGLNTDLAFTISANSWRPSTGGSLAGSGSPTGSLSSSGSLVMPSSPPRAGATRRRVVPKTSFRNFYDRGDMPISVFHGAVGGKLVWKVDIEKLDYHHYLPIFFDGLREKEEPYRFMAVQGCYDMLEKGGSKILPVVPQLIIPMKTALNTRDPECMTTMMKVIQQLVLSAELVGEALVPYYRQILPVFNIFKSKNQNIGDQMEYGQRKRQNIGDLIAETLTVLETHGGEDAFINIKYMIPTYESCVLA